MAGFSLLLTPFLETQLQRSHFWEGCDTTKSHLCEGLLKRFVLTVSLFGPRGEKSCGRKGRTPKHGAGKRVGET